MDACVVAAFGSHTPFFAQYEVMGTDSQIITGVSGDSSGKVTFMGYDSDPSGGSGAKPVLNAYVCENPAVDTLVGQTGFGAPPIKCGSATPLGRLCGG